MSHSMWGIHMDQTPKHELPPGNNLFGRPPLGGFVLAFRNADGEMECLTDEAAVTEILRLRAKLAAIGKELRRL